MAHYGLGTGCARDVLFGIGSPRWLERMLLREGHEIVLADSLQHQKHRGRVAIIGD